MTRTDSGWLASLQVWRVCSPSHFHVNPSKQQYVRRAERGRRGHACQACSGTLAGVTERSFKEKLSRVLGLTGATNDAATLHESLSGLMFGDFMVPGQPLACTEPTDSCKCSPHSCCMESAGGCMSFIQFGKWYKMSLDRASRQLQVPAGLR